MFKKMEILYKILYIYLIGVFVSFVCLLFIIKDLYSGALPLSTRIKIGFKVGITCFSFYLSSWYSVLLYFISEFLIKKKK